MVTDRRGSCALPNFNKNVKIFKITLWKRCIKNSSFFSSDELKNLING